MKKITVVFTDGQKIISRNVKSYYKESNLNCFTVKDDEGDTIYFPINNIKYFAVKEED